MSEPLETLLTNMETENIEGKSDNFEINPHLSHFNSGENDKLLITEFSKDIYDVEDLPSLTSRSSTPSRCMRIISRIIRFLVEDWMFLALLGISTAICSLAMEYAIENLQEWHIKTYSWAHQLESKADHFYFTYLVWMSYAVVLVTASALFVHYVAPQAIGSGIPEMKTILRGIILKEYLTFRTLISKMVGLTLSLGSGLPIGKEGPFVHVASVVAQQLSRFVNGFQGAYANESRASEMLAAGCAVGVACTFSAPIGGVLFSIEVTSVYFAVRNYWRGFFAALCAATTFRICRLWLTASEVTVVAYYQTRFPKEAFFPEELPAFAIIGLICGLAGAVFIKCHRSLALFLRKSSIAKRIIQKNWIIYPMLVAFLVSSLTYPKGYGQFLSGEHKFSHTLKMFLSNCTWTAQHSHHNACPMGFLDEWTGDGQNSIFLALTLFTVTFFNLSILSSTLPIPAGIFMPVFVIGASFGRLVGEYIAVLFPDGIRENDKLEIYPGVYAVVGAAAFCGAVTHTVSVAVIVFELTGQLMHILPVMIAVVISNAVSSYLQPSIYDSIIKMKHLPYLPDLSHASSMFHNINAEQIMIRNVKYICKNMSYLDIRDLIESFPRLRAFPIVFDKRSRVLLGSVSRSNLQEIIEERIGINARQAEATRRLREAFVRQNARTRLSLSGAETLKTTTEVPSRSGSYGRRFSVVHLPLSFLKDRPKSSKRHRGGRRHSECERAALAVNEKSRTFSGPVNNSQTVHSHDSIGDVFRRSITRLSFGRIHKASNSNDFDLHGEERRSWEIHRLSAILDFNALVIDPAPFQLVEHTSLFKVHSLFSLLGLSRAYVTKFGKLVGVVSLKELRTAIEKAQSGQLFPGGPSLYENIPEEDQISKADTDSEYEDRLQPRLEVMRLQNNNKYKTGEKDENLYDKLSLRRLLEKRKQQSYRGSRGSQSPKNEIELSSGLPTDQNMQITVKIVNED